MWRRARAVTPVARLRGAHTFVLPTVAGRSIAPPPLYLIAAQELVDRYPPLDPGHIFGLLAAVTEAFVWAIQGCCSSSTASCRVCFMSGPDALLRRASPMRDIGQRSMLFQNTSLNSCVLRARRDTSLSTSRGLAEIARK
ncbi:hypothetical protein B0H15DRAFT_135872 [Mycena belliarum]|uniref:Uncharacterized protein n=1 Tax=Mycena belliarum TaxID=1033014 RepID=A0AAD6UDB1_9AGAR|nr:hypothetical protein B0H15DRAFT_135872 [Mycena belliae]